VRRIPELLASGAGWDVRTLDHLGRMHLLLKAAERIGDLPADLGADVRTQLGWNQSKDEVLAGPRVADRWLVLGQVIEEEDRLRVRRTWLVGRNTQKRALVLDFAAGQTPFDQALVAGTECEGELAFYPARFPVRALCKGLKAGAITGDVGAASDALIDRALVGYAGALAVNPWLARWPLLLSDVRMGRDGDAWSIVDSTGAGLPIRGSFTDGPGVWRLLSVSGGAAVTVMAEWDGETALPLGVVRGTEFTDLAPRWGA
jgi:hypothetical protein